MNKNNISRRDFLKLSTASASALAVTALGASLVGCSEPLPTQGPWQVLRKQDRIMLSAIAPVMLKGSLPTEHVAQQQAIERMLQLIDAAIAQLGPYNTKQITDLFTLLNLGITRGLTTGVWSQWQDASDAQIDHFLHRWRESSIGLFNAGYNGLNKIMCATWFGQPQAWQAIGYPGPLYREQLITKA